MGDFRFATCSCSLPAADLSFREDMELDSGYGRRTTSGQAWPKNALYYLEHRDADRYVYLFARVPLCTPPHAFVPADFGVWTLTTALFRNLDDTTAAKGQSHRRSNHTQRSIHLSSSYNSLHLHLLLLLRYRIHPHAHRLHTRDPPVQYPRKRLRSHGMRFSLRPSRTRLILNRPELCRLPHARVQPVREPMGPGRARLEIRASPPPPLRHPPAANSNPSPHSTSSTAAG